MSNQAVSLNLIVKNPDEEYRLVEEALSGSCDAFKTLFTKNVSKVYSFCLHLSSDDYIAEELTQEVFINAWEKLRSFRFESKFSSWLHGIAVKKYLMHQRSQYRKDDKTAGLSKQTAMDAIKPHVMRQDAMIDIESALKKLPEQQRAVLVLHDIEGYKHKEISEMMGIEAGTSKAHLHKARKLLRQELSK